ncbi:NAD-dependent epimerase/dehydratase family protein [Nocardia sp. SYP-A9097]|uniref:thioester reductase domain-containing protein n=1 Tax=Nocardia sp. SYP-A9097 TaxID=2663237 RepID=UPI00129A9B5F|nr:thioester reductase domain-containing protein [Nocardia sp. SYP-A9097]MRH86146.1 NAD-dependent epimerase/dehydratase family protein [Nocardia sp. SYP-A9097]
MGDQHNGVPVRTPDVDRLDQAELVENGGGALDIAALLAAAGGAGAPPASAVPPASIDGNWDLERLTAAITAIAARLVPGAALDADTDFFEGGATSVAAVELVAELAREHGVELPLDDVFADARPRQLAKRWLRANGIAVDTGMPGDGTVPAVVAAPGAPAVFATTLGVDATADDTLAQILADIALVDRLPFVGPPPQTAPRRILLTGATGFLGSHMLLDLLRHSDAHVICLVRAADEQAGLVRLGDALTGFDLPWSVEVQRRITVLPGDVRSPRLGLTPERWNSLALEVDSIVGVAAAVDFLRGYSSLRQSNVLGALTLAELAVTGTVKPLHHISSIAVFNEVGVAAIGEDVPVARIDKLGAGYDKTKWAAEAALRRAREHGLTVTFLRPGGIGGHRETGAHNPHDLSSAMLAAISRFRTVPEFRCFNVASVDWVSRVAAAIVCEPSAWGYNYNLTGIPQTMDSTVREMALAGMPVRVQHWEQWRTEALDRIRTEPVPELDFLAWMLQSPGATDLIRGSLTAPPGRCDRTLAFVRRHKLPEPLPYDSPAQQKTFELMAAAGVARLPQREDTPYLWFAETMAGSVGASGAPADIPCEAALTLSITSMYQLVSARRVDVAGEITCPGVHSEPLTVERGDLFIRPQQGVPWRRGGLTHPLMRYRLTLRDADGSRWWLEGEKSARARRDVWRQVRALSIEIGREGEPAAFSGEIVVPSGTYLPDQIDGLRVNPDLSERQQRLAKSIWLAWFGAEVGRGALQPMLRAAAELLDLRRGATLKELP